MQVCRPDPRGGQYLFSIFTEKVKVTKISLKTNLNVRISRFSKGIQEGEKKGAKTREKEIAEQMLNKGMETKLIQELTGLSSEEFNRLKHEL